MATLRTAVNKAKPWAWGRANQLVNRKLAFSDIVGCIPIVVGRRLLPVSSTFNLACRHCFSQSTPHQPANLAANFNYDAVSCSNDNRDALRAAEYGLEAYNKYLWGKRRKQRISRLVKVVKARTIRLGWSMHEVVFEGIDGKGHSNIYYALVLHEPLQKMKMLIKCGLVDEQFPYPSWKERHLDTVENSVDIINFCTPWGQKNFLHSPTIARNAIVPVDTIAEKIFGYIGDEKISQYGMDEKIHKYALSAVEICNKNEGNKISLSDVLCVSKTEVGDIYFLLLTVKENANKYFAMLKVLQFKEELIKWCVVDELF